MKGLSMFVVYIFATSGHSRRARASQQHIYRGAHTYKFTPDPTARRLHFCTVKILHFPQNRNINLCFVMILPPIFLIDVAVFHSLHLSLRILFLPLFFSCSAFLMLSFLLDCVRSVAVVFGQLLMFELKGKRKKKKLEESRVSAVYVGHT